MFTLWSLVLTTHWSAVTDADAYDAPPLLTDTDPLEENIWWLLITGALHWQTMCGTREGEINRERGREEW